MIITDKNELRVLMTAFYVAKWETGPESGHPREVGESPIFAKLYNDLIDEVVANEHPPARVRWATWRAIENRPEQLALIKARIGLIQQWRGWSRDDRRESLDALLSPFTATLETLEDLLAL